MRFPMTFLLLCLPAMMGLMACDYTISDPASPTVSPAATPSSSAASAELVVEFDSSGQAVYGPGWETAVLGSEVRIASRDGVTGFLASGGALGDSYVRVSRTLPRAFTANDRVMVTWHSSSAGGFQGVPRLSFLDPNGIQGDETSARQWYGMGQDAYEDDEHDYGYQDLKLSPGQTRRTFYTVMETRPKLCLANYASAGSYSLIGVSFPSDAPAGMMITKIEIVPEDRAPPTVPSNVRVDHVDGSNVYVTWDQSPEADVKYYLVYVDGVMRIASPSANRTAVKVPYFSPGNASLQVSAIDWSRNESALSPALAVAVPEWTMDPGLLKPWRDLEYQGAFRLPTKGNNSMTYYPGGNGGSGSLILYPYHTSGVPNMMEVSIPQASTSRVSMQLPSAQVLRAFPSTPATLLPGGDQAVGGVAYHPRAGGQTQDFLYYNGLTFNYYGSGPTLGAVATDLSPSNRYGLWRVGPASPDNQVYPTSTGTHTQEFSASLFAFPVVWARDHLGGASLAAMGTHRMINGPTMYAVKPWDEGVPLPGDGSLLNFKRLLRYGAYDGVRMSDFPDAIDGFWRQFSVNGAAWVQNPAQSGYAVVMSVMKPASLTWYGFADGTRDLDIAYDIPATFDWNSPNQQRNEYCARPDYMFLFMDPNDLARVAAGRMDAHAPQPYAMLRPPLFLQMPHDDYDMVQYGYQRIFGQPAADWERGYLYGIEVYGASDDSDVVHVWKVL
jgi:hypothetical protein